MCPGVIEDEPLPTSACRIKKSISHSILKVKNYKKLRDCFKKIVLLEIQENVKDPQKEKIMHLK